MYCTSLLSSYLSLVSREIWRNADTVYMRVPMHVCTHVHDSSHTLPLHVCGGVRHMPLAMSCGRYPHLLYERNEPVYILHVSY